MGRPKAVDITSTPKMWLTKAEACGYLSIDDTDNFDVYFPNLTKHVPPGKRDKSNKYWYEKAEIDAMLAASTAQQVKDELLPPTMRRARIKHNTSS